MMTGSTPTSVPDPLIHRSFRDAPVVAATPEEGGVDDPAFAAAESAPPGVQVTGLERSSRLPFSARFKHLVFGEHSLTKVAGLFTSRSLAENAASQLRLEAGFDAARVHLLAPSDASGLRKGVLSRSLEPEQAGIWHTVVRAHLFTFSVGLALALLVYAGFMLAGHPAVTSSPGLSLMALLFFGGIVGLMVGGFLSLRPDHYRVLGAVRQALRKGQWAVIAHPVTPLEIEQALSGLRARSYRVVRSL